MRTWPSGEARKRESEPEVMAEMAEAAKMEVSGSGGVIWVASKKSKVFHWGAGLDGEGWMGGWGGRGGLRRLGPWCWHAGGCGGREGGELPRW